MKRIILFAIALAMILCLSAGCKSSNEQEESAMAEGIVMGGSQENAGAGANGPQKVEDSVTSSSDYDTSLGANQDLTPNTNAGSTNTGNTNTGSTNTGSTNTGNTNTGNANTGNTNTGSTNTGSINTGSTNTEKPNAGNTNTGNAGNTNTEKPNTGNAGNTNTGNVDKNDTNGTTTDKKDPAGNNQANGGTTTPAPDTNAGNNQAGSSTTNPTPDADVNQNNGEQIGGGENNGSEVGGNENAGNGETTPPADAEQPEEEDPYAAMKADTSGTKIKIMCQNLRLNSKEDQGGDNDAQLRRYRFQSLVEKYDPDIIAGQEADPFWLEILPLDYGAKYDMFYKQRGATTGSDEACPILWKKDKYEKLDDGYFWLSDTPDVASPSFIPDTYPRIVNWVTLKDKATGSKFNIYSTHFGFYDEQAHIEAIRNLIIKAFRKIPFDTYGFVMGDFNFNFETSQYYVFTDEINVTDLRVVSKAMAENGHCTLGDIRTGSYNDFIADDGLGYGDFIMALPRKRLAIDTFGYLYEKPGNDAAKVNPGFVSDHFAVYTEVRIDTDISYEEYYSPTAK